MSRAHGIGVECTDAGSRAHNVYLFCYLYLIVCSQPTNKKGACIGAWGFEAMSGIEVGTRKILGYRSVSSHGVLICRRPLFGVSYLFCQQVHLESRHGCGGL